MAQCKGQESYDDADFFGLDSIRNSHIPRSFITNKKCERSLEQPVVINDPTSRFTYKKLINDLQEPVHIQESSSQFNGLKIINELIDPVWKFSSDDLVRMIADRVIYDDDDLIAYDKPYQLAYASGPKNQLQMDRLLQGIKKLTCPNVDRLHLVNSLDKNCSGIMLFAKSLEKRAQINDLIAKDQAIFRFRSICKNFPSEPKGRISIPLIKVLRDQNFKLCPLIGNADRDQQLYHFNTDYRVINDNNKAFISLIDSYLRRGMPHLVRSHLYYGLNCPVVGDSKYVKPSLSFKNVPKTKISPYALSSLKLKKSDVWKLPLFLHLSEVHIPLNSSGKYAIVRCNPPPYFLYALKNLKLLRK